MSTFCLLADQVKPARLAALLRERLPHRQADDRSQVTDGLAWDVTPPEDVYDDLIADIGFEPTAEVSMQIFDGDLGESTVARITALVLHEIGGNLALDMEGAEVFRSVNGVRSTIDLERWDVVGRDLVEALRA